MDYPLPDFFTFVFTDVKGRHLHVACLRFYEIVSKEEYLSVFENTYKMPPEVIVYCLIYFLKPFF